MRSSPVQRYRVVLYTVGLSLPLATLVHALGQSKQGAAITSPAATVQPPALNQKLKVFVSPDQIVYWPIDLPFYVRLAPSPNAQGESYLLKQATIRSTKGSRDELTEGLKLEIPGAQFIRWVNHVSKDEVMYRFVADGGPPNVELTWNDVPRYENGSALFFGRNLKATLRAQDDHSGVKHTYFQVDDAPVSTYQAALSFEQEKDYRLSFYAIDQVGYEGKPTRINFRVDLTPPTTTLSYSPEQQNPILARTQILRLSSEDQAAGVSAIFYKFNNEAEFQRYDDSQGISLEDLKDGSQILRFFAVDQVANRESPKEWQFYLDRSAPSVAHTFSGDSYQTEQAVYMSPRTRVKLDASDAAVAVKDILYAIDGGSEKTYTTPFTPPGEGGPVTLEYRARDSLANTSAKRSVRIIVDADPPLSTESFQGPIHKRESGTVYLGPKATIQLSAKDEASGVGKIEYQLNDQAPETYQAPFELPREGRYLFRRWATDLVNNQETYSPTLLIADWTAPEIVANFSTEPWGATPESQTSPSPNLVSLRARTSGQAPAAASESIPIYAPGTSVSLRARDAGAGREQVEYAIGDGEWQTYKSALNFPKEGLYLLRMKARDAVGNQSEVRKQFRITSQKGKKP